MLVGNRHRVFVYGEAVDFRKGHNGLKALTSRAGLNLWAGDVVVFFSKCRSKTKVLVADETGIWLHYKQLSRWRFAQRVQAAKPGDVVAIRQDELNLLLSGSQYKIEKPAKSWKPKNIGP